MNKKLLICGIALLTGCAFYQPNNAKFKYNKQIKEWQYRQQQEWNEKRVDTIISYCIKMSRYRLEPKGVDHWQTYYEFLDNNLIGDCEDIGAFIKGTLYILKCPFPVRMKALDYPIYSEDHMIISVKFPHGWKDYNTVPMPLDFIDISLSDVIVEWDYTNIYN